jgi:hypothetical protein
MIRRRPVVIANEIRLKRSQHKGSFLVVEGRDDRLFCERFIDTSTCNIVVAENKENVCEVIRILDDDHFLGALGMVDADFDRIEGSELPSVNIVISETHDLETMLIRSPALDRVLVEFGSSEKLETFGRDVRDALLTATLPIGYLRLHSRQTELNLRFQGLNYAICVDPQSLEVDHPALVQEAKNRSQRPDLSSAELETAIRSLEGTIDDPWQVCTGEDMVSILAIGLRRPLGTNSAQIVNSEVLRRSLRLAYGDNEFNGSQLAEALRDWEHRNPNFRVLR